MLPAREEQELILIERLRKGDEEAKREYYELFYSYLAATCARYLPKDRDIRDILHDVFVKLYIGFDKFEYRGVGSLQAWSKQVAVNECLLYLRARKRSVKIFPLVENFSDKLYDEETTENAIKKIPAKDLIQMIRTLPEKYRLVFNLYVFEEKSHREIAVLLGIKENSSASNLHRARELLIKK